MKILIGCPTYEKYRYCLDKYVEAVKKIDHDHYDILLVDNSKDDTFFHEIKEKGVPVEKIKYCESAKERIVQSRNLLIQRAIEGNYDYFFSLEQDIIVQPDIVKRLLQHKKDVVSGYYAKKVMLTLQDEDGKLSKAAIELPVVWLQGENGIRRANASEIKKQGLKRVGAAGLGCILISKKVFSKTIFRYDPRKKAFDDMFFCRDVKNLGFNIYVDSDIEVEHLHRKWDEKENHS